MRAVVELRRSSALIELVEIPGLDKLAHRRGLDHLRRLDHLTGSTT